MFVTHGGSFGSGWPGVSDREFRLDTRRGWLLSEEESKRFSSELVQLCQLFNGMHLIYDAVKTAEKKLHERLLYYRGMRAGPDVAQAVFGIHGAADSMFQWYAMSLCKYADLVYAVALSTGRVMGESQRTAYRKEVCGEVWEFRNKVAAHFSRTWPKEDSPETQRLSVMTQMTVVNGRLVVGVWRLANHQPVEPSTSPRMVLLHAGDGKMQWSLTAMHEWLASRYYWVTTIKYPHEPMAPRDEDTSAPSYCMPVQEFKLGTPESAIAHDPEQP